MTAMKIKRLFIANRGEIARRIATTARRLGIESVCLTDRAAPPAYLLDVVTDFVRVGHESPALYLDAEAMVRAARDSGCDALHPGFGFLSENAGFAARVEAAGLIWVGPSPQAIEAMASKAGARTYAEKAGVPVVQGVSGFTVPADAGGDFSALEAFADQVGYPLLIKAALGGGGKGMRQVHAKGELREAALRCRSEAVNSFGDGALICEQYLTAPRHVEVQILADKHKNVYAVGDRDCSVQRRHQKIIEEAPAPALGPKTRKALHAAAVRLAQAVGYDSTGTVEFLVDWSPASAKATEQSFFFLEMNTRLQVEHPVTEEVFGMDLVQWQLRVAGGERLPDGYKTLAPRGHSVEVRIYAEDVGQNFFPSPGPVAAFRPALGPGIRWEMGLDELDQVTGRFDPMIAKLVATGETRTQALERLCDALERTFLAGPATNVDLLWELCRRGPFANGPVTTHYLVQNLDEILAATASRRGLVQKEADELLAALMGGKLAAASAAEVGGDVERLTREIFGAGSSRNTGTGKLAASAISTISGIKADRLAAFVGRGLTAGSPKPRPFWYAALTAGGDEQFWIAFAGLHFTRKGAAKASARTAAGAGPQTDILAPVPGKVIAIKVTPGAKVSTNQSVFVLESMKMEFEVKAAKDGVIDAVNVKIGDQVTAGLKLAHWAE